jgi:ribonuclease-3
MSSLFKELEKQIGISFKDKKLLQNAFVHRSYLNENPNFGLPSNERLEFLGDAVLELIVSHRLFQKFPNLSEGKLTALRAALVKTVSLADEAKKLNLGDFLLLSKGEEEGEGRSNPYLLANTFEALVGALYLDQGLEATSGFTKERLLYKAKEALQSGLKDAKSLFQEKAQERHSVTPSYKTFSEWGPDHNKKFRVAVFLGKKKIAEGEGKSKQIAEEDAANEALRLMGTG